MSCTGQANCACGCCAGIAVQTPQGGSNPPGQSSIAYRTGAWATFKNSMLARLSSSDYPALAGLTTRANNDYSIALLDASAVVLDILTFYQERLANESYLGTANQIYSLTQLSQLIGYQPSPGVSASVYLAFTLSHRRHHHPRRDNSAKRSWARANPTIVPNLERHPRQTRLEHARRPDGQSLAPAAQ
jgi:hypothetical protein